MRTQLATLAAVVQWFCCSSSAVEAARLRQDSTRRRIVIIVGALLGRRRCCLIHTQVCIENLGCVSLRSLADAGEGVWILGGERIDPGDQLTDLSITFR